MATAASTSMAATAVFLPCRLPTSAVTPRCSALPCLPPPRFSSTQGFSTSLKQMSEPRRISLFQVKASSSEESSPPVDAGEIFSDLKEKWDAVENKSTVILYGGGAIVAVWLSSIVVGAINSVPLEIINSQFLWGCSVEPLIFFFHLNFYQLPKIMELVGLGYTGWFVYRYLLFKQSRKELATDIESLKKKIAGTE